MVARSRSSARRDLGRSDMSLMLVTPCSNSLLWI